ncbi:ATP-binding protein [Falsiroseomonas sp.]|uniref:ATP-binding protein n=1 Tax=Falsiroseomonas sp. TaxID=2870721 RepID=UPI0035672752
MPEAPTLSLAIPLAREGLAPALDRIEAFLVARGAAEGVRYKVRLVLDELLANLMAHGRFAGPPPPIRVEVAARQATVLLLLEDAAEPFDPRLAPDPPGPPSLADDRLGGLGLPLVRRMAEIRGYRRLPEGWNRTELAISAG